MFAQNFTPIDDLIKKLQQASVSLPKEAEPIPGPSESLHLQESVEHEPSDEVTPYVQPRAESIKLPSDLTMIGLQPVSATQFSSYKNIKLPISDEKIIKGLHEPITSSYRWLAEFAVFVLRQSHLALRVVHGKIIRVIRS